MYNREKKRGKKRERGKYVSKNYRQSINMRDMKGICSRRNHFIDIIEPFRDLQYPSRFDLSHSSHPVARPNISN